VVNQYIDDVWHDTITFIRSLKWEKGTEELAARFQSHTTAEEERLQQNLEDIKYGIDSHEVVRLISGHGRIETVWFPILYTRNRLTPDRPCSRCYILCSKDICRKSALLENRF
jgi:hypothetical protein